MTTSTCTYPSLQRMLPFLKLFFKTIFFEAFSLIISSQVFLRDRVKEIVSKCMSLTSHPKSMENCNLGYGAMSYNIIVL